MSWITSSGQIVTGGATAYMMYKINRHDVLLAALLPNAVDALGKNEVYCSLPPWNEYLHLAILALLIGLVVPNLAVKAFDLLKTGWDYAVENAAERRRRNRTGP
jgi:hypothetical protein